ncbi:MAG TPA: ROK family protein [Ktedonobacterales bacterium]|nr:ROK family protein [Ktedonobacterales bacterium]
MNQIWHEHETIPNHSHSMVMATQGYVLGVEISSAGMQMSVALADLQGQIVHRTRKRLSAPPEGQEAVALLHEMITDVCSPERLRGNRVLRCGIAIGAPVDAARGQVRMMYRAEGWEDLPVKDLLEQRCQIPAILDNDANAAALGEASFGAGIGERNLVYVGLGRGIGGGILVNGSIYHGVGTMAGEIGHTLVKEDGPLCPCGRRGHLEGIASAQAIVRTMIGVSVEYPQTEEAIRRVTGGRAEAMTADQVFQIAAKGDPVARQVIDEALHYLSISLANLVNLLDPGVIILGGALALAGDLLFEPLRQMVPPLCLRAATEAVRIVPAALGSDASLKGAVALALQDV